ncbi:nucleotide-diphospho-sugar transferase [Aspergillus californicus]
MTPTRWESVPIPGSRYLIEREAKDRDALPLDSSTAAAILFLRWLLYGAYLFRRYTMIDTLSPSGLVCTAWLVFLIEIGARFGQAMFQADMGLYLLFRRQKAWQRPRHRLVGAESPTVDVFVTCCGEDVELVMDTVRAAASQDYPLSTYRVFVLDDAGSQELHDAIHTYNTDRPHTGQEVHYLARTKNPGKPHYFKAGNLRFGLQESRKKGRVSEYIAALDVDAIPETDWLRRMVPHLILDEHLGAIVPGLHHYNLPADDVLYQDVATPWDITIEHMRDAMGVSNLYGSGYLMRRSALDSIGGWPLVPSAEDLFCGHLLAGQGWKIGFCWDVCQHDLTPGSFDALVGQRLRWTEGDLNMSRRFNFFIPWLDPGRRRTPARTATSVIGALRLYKGVVDMLILLLAPSLLLALQFTDIATLGRGSNDSILRGIYLASILLDRLSPLFTSGLLMSSTTSISWFTPFEALATIRYHLPNTNMRFVPTGTVISSANERCARLRKPLIERLSTTPMRLYLAHLLLCVVSLVAFFLRFLLASDGAKGGSGFTCTPVLVIVMECIPAMSVPGLYMMWPPTVAERTELLDAGDRGLVRPNAAATPVSQPSIPNG